jgi:hypothetical protein
MASSQPHLDESNVPDHRLGTATESALFSHILDNFQITTTMSDEKQIQRALSHLKAQKQPNIAAALKKFNIPRQTLSDRFHGHTMSRAEATVNTHLKLSPTQEKTFIIYINKLSDRELPLISGIIRNLV